MRLKQIPYRIRTTIRRLRRAPKVIKQSVLIIIGAILLGEVPSLLDDFFPEISGLKKNWYLRPGFSLKHDRQLCWVLKDSLNDVFVICILFVCCKFAKQYSDLAFIIMFVFLCYGLVDAGMYWWDFKTSHYVYADLIFTCLTVISGIMNGEKPKTLAKIKSIF